MPASRRDTAKHPPPKDPALFFRHYPIRLYMFADGVFVTRIASAHAALAGARVVAIGGTPIDSAMAAIDPVVHRDNDMQRMRHLPERLVIPEILHARGVIADMGRATFLLETGDGKTHELVLTPVDGDPVDWAEVAMPRTPRYLKDTARNFWFTYLEDSRTVYWQYNTVYDEEDETVAEFAGRLFGFIEANPVDRVVVDLRHNYGGNNGLNRALIHALIRCTKTREPGTLYAIVGRGTFSAAMMFSVDLEKHTNVIFVGEPTGSTPNHFGDSRKMQLPNSGLTVRASTLYHQYSGPRDDRPWIEPHIAAVPSSGDYRAGRDVALEAILDAAAPAARGEPIDPAGEWMGRVIDYRVIINLQRADDGWTGTLDVPDVGARDLPLSGFDIAGPRVAFVLPDEGGDVSFVAEMRGKLLIGQAHYGRRTYPFALVRVQ